MLHAPFVGATVSPSVPLDLVLLEETAIIYLRRISIISVATLAQLCRKAVFVVLAAILLKHIFVCFLLIEPRLHQLPILHILADIRSLP